MMNKIEIETFFFIVFFCKISPIDKICRIFQQFRGFWWNLQESVNFFQKMALVDRVWSFSQ